MELDWLLAPPLPAAVPRQRLLYLRLRESILSGALKPGQRLSETDLARRFGISRGPLREAIGQLEGRRDVRDEAVEETGGGRTEGAQAIGAMAIGTETIRPVEPRRL